MQNTQDILKYDSLIVCPVLDPTDWLKEKENMILYRLISNISSFVLHRHVGEINNSFLGEMSKISEGKIKFVMYYTLVEVNPVS